MSEPAAEGGDAAAAAPEDAAAAAPAEDGAEPVEEPVILDPPCVDLSSCMLKIDHFDQMHGLGKEKIVEGSPNFRQA